MRQFRIVVVGHGPLAAGLLASAEMICGPIDGIAAVGLRAHETPDHFGEALRAAIGHDDRSVLVLADLAGGTPFNVAAAIARRSPRVICLSGVNLPMLIEAVLGIERLDDDAVERLLHAGREGIVEISRQHARRAS